MNKRIQKKKAKQALAQELGVADAYHRLEQDVMSLAHALFSEGREKSAAALSGAREFLNSSEQSLEELVSKLPGMGPQLAQLLHGATHGTRNGGASEGQPSKSRDAH